MRSRSHHAAWSGYGFETEINVAERRQRENALMARAAVEQDYFKGGTRRLTEEIEKSASDARDWLAELRSSRQTPGPGFHPEEMDKTTKNNVTSGAVGGAGRRGDRRF